MIDAEPFFLTSIVARYYPVVLLMESVDDEISAANKNRDADEDRNEERHSTLHSRYQLFPLQQRHGLVGVHQ